MSLSSRLLGLKGSQLKHAAFLMGLPSTGTKADLESLIRQRLLNPPVLDARKHVVSIDMGIKNLGICVLQVPQEQHVAETENSTRPSPIKIIAWRKVDVLSQLTATVLPLQFSLDKESGKSLGTGKVRPSPSTFTPSNLSETAVSISQSILQHYDPQHILIERQRFRSGGASAVQEWTLRVNMLEAMLWAAFTTMRAQSLNPADLPDLHEISPARVANFWCARPAGVGTRVPAMFFEQTSGNGSGTAAGVKEGRKKVDKKDKIALVRSWLSGEALGRDQSLTLELSDDARDVADSFLGGKSTRMVAPKHDLNKLDDLADCLLQGVAWLRWRENGVQLNGEVRLRDTIA